MSEPKLISPMLDNFGMGAPISDHNGVRCCPAMELGSEDKYIVKVISIPASSRQLDALLLSGAYSNQDAAKEYFHSLAQDVTDEAAILQKLANVEGFVPYTKWQVVEMEDAVGYDVYLMSAYRRTLERHLRRNTMTHLAAVNLGLDLCAALAACRRSGYLYVDLKPENVFITEEQEYRIGDLGFIRLGSLQYASLPDKYRSQYTAPEITDAFSALNTTLDTYALGLMLYQAYNDSKLPFEGEQAPAADFPAPAYADEEMAQIILKACAADPKDRWEDPVQMGHALVAYMQRNEVNDTPIVPTEADEPVEILDDEIASSRSGAFIKESEVNEVTEDASESLDEVEATEDISVDTQDETAAVLLAMEDIAHANDAADVDISDETADSDECAPAEAEESPNEEAAEGAEEEEEEFENLSFLDYLEGQTDVSGFTEEELTYDALSQDVSDMLNQADDLATLTVPEPVVAPEPIEVPMPTPIVPETEEAPAAEEVQPEEDIEEATVSEEEADEAEQEEEDLELEETPYLPEPGGKKRKGRWIAWLIVLTILAGIAFGGFYYYQNIYLQTIDSIILEGNEGTLSVFLVTETDEKLLTVYCSDSYGNRIAKPVENGWAVFTDLDPNTYYHIEVAIEGFHELRGETGKTYSTPVQTEIVQMNAVAGGVDGSVILSFTTKGPDSAQWTVSYWADGEARKELTFSNHTVSVTGLTIGKDYTFSISPVDDLFVTGKKEVNYKATALIYAQDLKITGCSDTSITAAWKAPAGIHVNSWTVRCYNDTFNETKTVSGTEVTFTGIDHAQAYTIEVTANGMSVSQRVHFTANTMTVSNFQANFPDATKLVITWDSCTSVSADGWVLLYTIDGMTASAPIVTTENSVTISSLVPGATYEITLQTAAGAPVLGGTFSCKAPEAKVFSCTYEGFAITGSNMIFHMCKTPSKTDWGRNDLSASDYTTTFTVGQKASFLVQMTRQYGTSSTPIETLFVIRDAEGKLVSTGTSTRTWTNMWYKNYCELDIPNMPATAGEYKVYVYFNGGLAAQVDFSVV